MDEKTREHLENEITMLRQRVAELEAAQAEHRRTEKAPEPLFESKAKFRLLAENIQEVFWISTPTLERMIYVSPAFERIWGRTCASLYQQPLSFLEAIHPDDRGRVKAALPGHSQGSWDIEYRIIQPDGAVRWILDRGFPIRDERGQMVQICGLASDITEHKRAEEERAKMEAQLFQAQKMESAGRLAGGVAHDFNNLLTVISGNAELAAVTPHLPEDAREHLSEITRATERAAALTRQLLAFSRRQSLAPRVVSLNDVLLNMDKMLRRLIGEDIEFMTQTAKDLWDVRVDVGQIEQVIANLAVNARDAMPRGGKLVLETANTQLDEEYAKSHAEVTPGDYVMLAISDTGVGMTDEVKEHIFEPFFTTKEIGKGTGLGLATCHGIVKQSGGHISAYSEPGHGTTFKIYLPRVIEESATLPQRQESAEILPRGSETILLVEDDSSVRSVTSRILRDHGYKVLQAGNGEEALQIIQRAPGRTIHLVLSDVVMPQMGGRELLQRLKVLRVSTKVLFTSGYTDTVIGRNGALELDVPLLQKPFTLSDLARKVREVLDS